MRDFKDYMPHTIRLREERERKLHEKKEIESIEYSLLFRIEANLTGNGGSFDIVEGDVLFNHIEWIKKKLTGIGWDVKVPRKKFRLPCHGGAYSKQDSGRKLTR